MKTVVWVRKSGTTLETADTKGMRAWAKEQGWKKQAAAPEPTPTPQLDMGDNND